MSVRGDADEGHPIMKKTVIALVVVAVSLGGCANLTPGEQRALTGTGIGAAGGAVIGAMAGNAALGAGVGAAAGLAGGLLVNAWKNSQETSFNQGYAAGQQSR
jgi:hypothetical protein